MNQAASTDYRPGACNIGADEIARRRMLGHVGVVITVAFLALLLAAHVPLGARFAVALPAWGTAVAYLQAWRRFCVAYGVLGVFNFGRVGDTHRVEDPALRARDRRRGIEIVVLGFFAGLVSGAVAVLPI